MNAMNVGTLEIESWSINSMSVKGFFINMMISIRK